MFLTVFYIAHFFSCIWFHIGVSSENSWLDQSKLRNSYWKEKYIHSLYYTIVTMITVGYGDVTPKTLYEKIFVIFFMLFACGVFAYSLNRVGVIIQEMFQKEDEFRYNFLKEKIK